MEVAMPIADEIIRLLNLKPHPSEGGLFTETYRSEEAIAKDALPVRYRADRCLATAVYYMLTPESFSAMHRLKSDEIFHFYLGDPVTMLQLRPDGSSEIIALGRDIQRREKLQVVVKRGLWQGMYLNEGGEFALLGATVSPGFEYDDFELGVRDKLVKQYPLQREMITRLTL
jgi:predicted cupin superfamily sugar epimerase